MYHPRVRLSRADGGRRPSRARAVGCYEDVAGDRESLDAPYRKIRGLGVHHSPRPAEGPPGQRHGRGSGWAPDPPAGSVVKELRCGPSPVISLTPNSRRTIPSYVRPGLAVYGGGGKEGWRTRAGIGERPAVVSGRSAAGAGDHAEVRESFAAAGERLATAGGRPVAVGGRFAATGGELAGAGAASTERVA